MMFTRVHMKAQRFNQHSKRAALQKWRSKLEVKV